MIHALETVVLLHDVPEHDFKSGDVGTVLHRYGEGNAFAVEFVTAEGKTLALTLTESDVRQFHGSEVLHVRDSPATTEPKTHR